MSNARVGFISIAILCTFAPEGFACESVYANATRNVTFLESSFSTFHAIYDEYCSGSDYQRDNFQGIDLAAVVKGIPVQLGGSSSSAIDRMERFCETYSSKRYDAGGQFVQRDDVVVDALKNYNTCREIEQNGKVEISATFSDPDALAIGFEFSDTTTAFAIDGFTSSGNLTCSIAPENTSRRIPIDEESPRITITYNFNILCTRRYVEANGVKEYAPANVLVATNLGRFAVPVHSDTLYGNHLASQASAKIAELEGVLSSTRSTLANESEIRADLQRRIEGLTVKSYVFIFWSV